MHSESDGVWRNEHECVDLQVAGGCSRSSPQREE